MICKNCGSYNDDTANFCIGCGAVLSEQRNENAETNANAQTFAQNTQGNTYNQPYNAQPVNAPVPGKGMAIAGMVCGIVAFFCYGIILGILGIVFGAIAKSKGYKGGMATAGIACGIVAIALWIILLIVYSSAMTSLLFI